MSLICLACATKIHHQDVRLHLVLRRFKNWSGTWTNSVVCDGKTVAGEKVTP